MVVHTYGLGAAYEVEFLKTDGSTLRVETIATADLLASDWPPASTEQPCNPKGRQVVLCRLTEHLLGQGFTTGDAPENATHPIGPEAPRALQAPTRKASE